MSGVQNPSVEEVRIRRTYASTITGSIVVNATAADKTLGTVVVPALPTGYSIVSAFVAVAWRKGVESSTVANAVNVAQNIQIQKGAGAFATVIALPDNSLAHAASATEGGSLLSGDTDVAATVDGAATYTIKWTLADVDGASLTFHDVQVFIILELSK